MSLNYIFHNPKGLYFVSFAVVAWLHVFTRIEYKDILLQCLTFYQKEQVMEIIAGPKRDTVAHQRGSYNDKATSFSVRH